MPAARGRSRPHHSSRATPRPRASRSQNSPGQLACRHHPGCRPLGAYVANSIDVVLRMHGPEPSLIRLRRLGEFQQFATDRAEMGRGRSRSRETDWGIDHSRRDEPRKRSRGSDPAARDGKAPYDARQTANCSRSRSRRWFTRRHEDTKTRRGKRLLAGQGSKLIARALSRIENQISIFLFFVSSCLRGSNRTQRELIGCVAAGWVVLARAATLKSGMICLRKSSKESCHRTGMPSRMSRFFKPCLVGARTESSGPLAAPMLAAYRS